MSAYEPHSHCSFCGHRFDPDQAWPRHCRSCGNRSYRNPLPVSVLLLPVNGGLLAVRRALTPGRGKLALPGGFVELPETWQEAGARELREEAGIAVDPQTVAVYRVYSASDGTILIFGLAPPWRGELPPFKPNGESSERLVIHDPCDMAFSLHTRVVEEYFRDQAQGAEPATSDARRTS